LSVPNIGVGGTSSASVTGNRQIDSPELGCTEREFLPAELDPRHRGRLLAPARSAARRPGLLPRRRRERKLPDLVADLSGQIHVDLVGFIDSVKIKGTEKSRVRTRFASVPDAPVSRFELKLYGGKRDLPQNSSDVCKGLGRAKVQMTGQNGKIHDFDPRLPTSCPRPRARPRSRGRRGSGAGG
jgi:hypothetical protein